MMDEIFLFVFLFPFVVTWWLVRAALSLIASPKRLWAFLATYIVLSVATPLVVGSVYLLETGRHEDVIWMVALVLLGRALELYVLSAADLFAVLKGGNLANTTATSADTQIYMFPQKRWLLVSCVVMLIEWGLLFVFLSSVLIYLFSSAPFPSSLEWLSLPLIELFIFGAFFFAIIAWRLRCHRCGNRFLLESSLTKHSSAHRIKGLSYWATTVLDILFRGQFSCMYCGQRYWTLKPRKEKFMRKAHKY